MKEMTLKTSDHPDDPYFSNVQGDGLLFPNLQGAERAEALVTIDPDELFADLPESERLAIELAIAKTQRAEAYGMKAEEFAFMNNAIDALEDKLEEIQSREYPKNVDPGHINWRSTAIGFAVLFVVCLLLFLAAAIF